MSDRNNTQSTVNEAEYKRQMNAEIAAEVQKMLNEERKKQAKRLNAEGGGKRKTRRSRSRKTRRSHKRRGHTRRH